MEQTPKQFLKDLPKLTGFSAHGIGKRIMFIKRFQLITCGTGRPLLLSEKAHDTIQISRS